MNGSSPRISVLMPAYNSEKYIASSIESILNQSFGLFELLIADDCSTDDTWQIIQEYAKKDKRIKPIRNESNLYIARNRNKLLDMARAKYIAWQDADDIALVQRLEKQYNFLEKNYHVGIIGGYLEIFDDKRVRGIRKYSADDRMLRKKIFRYSPVAQPAAMIRRKCFDELGNYDPKYPPAEDIDMSFRIGTKYLFANLEEVILKYRQSETSSTFKKLNKIEFDTIEIRKKYYNSPFYKVTLADIIYNIVEFMLIFVLPPKARIRIFSMLRDTKV